MFDFFKKKREQKARESAEGALYNSIFEAFNDGAGNPLEGALAMCHLQRSQEAAGQLLMVLSQSEVFTLNKGPERLTDTVTTQGSSGHEYVAVFTSAERALRAAPAAQPYDRVGRVHTCEILFALSPEIGLVLNFDDDLLDWTLTPPELENLRAVLLENFELEVGGIYTVWSRNSYGAIKILHVDEGGIHIRLYGQTWEERPTEMDPTILTVEGPFEETGAIGHMPVSKRGVLRMGPKHAAQTEVSEDELDGYRSWQEAQGGYFD